MWTLDTAQQTVNTLESLATPYFFALTGGCIYRGASEHDLDLVCVSMSGEDKHTELFALIKEQLGWEAVSNWHYSSSMSVFKFRDELGRFVELWVCGCSPMPYTRIDAIGKWVKATARQFRLWYGRKYGN